MGAGAQVLVVGAGPSGLLAAVELARHGVAVRLVEREPEPHREARATAIQPGTLEILAQAGVAAPFLAAAAHVKFARVLDEELRPLSESSFARAGGHWDIQCSLPQWQTERLLTARLAELGGTVERGVSLVSLEPHSGGVHAGLEHAGGRAELAEARWVVGAGGAHSVTRASLDEELAGQTYPGLALAADVAVSCGLPRDGSALIATARGYVLLAPLPGERWITFVGDLDQAEAARLSEGGGGPEAAAELVRAALERRAGGAVTVDDVGWAAQFRMHRRLAPHLAGPRRFLLGDAGHLSSPLGGEGLNSGLHDAHNLAWKLALELRGQARPGLLASYPAERGAAAQHVIETSDQVHALAHGAVQTARTGVAAEPLSPARAEALTRARALLDTSYAESPLTGQFLAPGAAVPDPPAPGDRYPDRVTLPGPRHHLLLYGPPGDGDGAGVEALGRRWRGLVDVVQADGDARRAGLGGSGAVLVRPDGYIGFRAAPAGPAALAAVDAHLSTYLIPVRDGRSGCG
jgi:2-polyprenyl-6-methoxyphenol hydroxylase-like FAD-dependent oxidoreductase